MIRKIHDPTSYILLVYPYDIIRKLYNTSIDHGDVYIGLIMYTPGEANLWDRLYISYKYNIQESDTPLKISRLIRFFLLLVTVPLFRTEAAR